MWTSWNSDSWVISTKTSFTDESETFWWQECILYTVSMTMWTSWNSDSWAISTKTPFTDKSETYWWHLTILCICLGDMVHDFAQDLITLLTSLQNYIKFNENRYAAHKFWHKIIATLTRGQWVQTINDKCCVLIYFGKFVLVATCNSASWWMYI